MNAVPEFPNLFNIEAEGDVIGTMLQTNAVIDRAADRLNADDFYEATHGQLFDLIVREFATGRPVSPVTLKPYLDAIPQIEELGGLQYLLKLTSQSGLHVTFAGCMEQIAELSRRRKIVDGLADASAMAGDMDAEIGDIISAADTALAGNEAMNGISQLSVTDCVDELLNTDRRAGVECKTIPEFDQIAGQLRKKELAILAGRPGMGKTAVALSYCLGAAQGGHGVLFISLEMSAGELAARMVADLCFDGSRGVPYSNIRDMELSQGQRREFEKARRITQELPFRVVDAGKLTTGRLAMIVMRTKRRMEAQGQSLDLVVVDYLQLLSTDHQVRGLYEKVSEISMALKQIAKTHDVSVMALAQLSRQVEQRENKRPQLSDLRDSGQIEQDADAVFFLLRDHYYHMLEKPEEHHPDFETWKDREEDSRHAIDFICAKRRNGLTGSARGAFYGQFQAVRGAI